MKHSLSTARTLFVGGLMATVQSLAYSGRDAYHCEVMQQVTVQSDGKALVEPRRATYPDAKLSIQRRTGATVGNAVGHLLADGPRVLAQGNAQNAFVAMWLGPARGDGVHLDVLRIEEYGTGDKKRFVALAGGTIYTGLCE